MEGFPFYIFGILVYLSRHFVGDFTYEQLLDQHKMKAIGSLDLSICTILKFLNSTFVLHWEFKTYIMLCMISLLLEGLYIDY